MRGSNKKRNQRHLRKQMTKAEQKKELKRLNDFMMKNYPRMDWLGCSIQVAGNPVYSLVLFSNN